jgi:hypothetical protein
MKYKFKNCIYIKHNIISGSGVHSIHSGCKHIVWQPVANYSDHSVEELCSSSQLSWHMFRHAAQSTSPQANKSQTKPTQISADAGSAPWLCVHSPCTFIQGSHSCDEVPFQKLSKLGTWHFKARSSVQEHKE